MSRDDGFTPEFWLSKPFAQAYRHKAGPHESGVQESGFRAYKSDPDGVTLQWRVQSRTMRGEATAGGTLAHGHLSWDEVAQLRDFLTTLLKKQ